jgi:hypothetical protein
LLRRHVPFDSIRPLVVQLLRPVLGDLRVRQFGYGNDGEYSERSFKALYKRFKPCPWVVSEKRLRPRLVETCHATGGLSLRGHRQPGALLTIVGGKSGG